MESKLERVTLFLSVLLGLMAMSSLAQAEQAEQAEQSGQSGQSGQQTNSGGVAGSGMSQGSGSITTRSDVSLSVESLPGTSALRLGAIGQAVGSQMQAIRTCYVQVAERRPTTTGTLRFSIRIPRQRRPPAIQIAENTTNDRQLTNCVLRALRAASYTNVRGPAGGMIVVDFTNTAAQGARMVARQAAQQTAAVQTVDGHPQTTTRTSGGEVTVTVRGTGQTNAQAVGALSQAIQARVGTLLDCRRRAGRRGQNPAGEIVLTLRVPFRGAAVGRSRSSTVEEPSTPQCVLRSLRQAPRRNRAAAGTYRITVRFAPRQ